MTGYNVLFKNWYLLRVKDFQTKPTKQNRSTSSKFPTDTSAPFYVASPSGQISTKQMKLLLPSGKGKEKLNPSANLKMTRFILRITQ